MTTNTCCWAVSASVLLTLLMLGGIQPAYGQTKEFNVPAQPATTGIPEFARQAEIQILVSEPLVRDKRTAAVVGSYSISEALAILLTGTQLSAADSDGRSITLHSNLDNDPNAGSRQGQSSGGDSLDEVVVVGAKRKFAPTDSNAATKIPMRIIDTPQSLSVLSSELMSIVGAKSLTKALAWAPGVTNTSQEIGFYNQASVRGFALSDFNSYKIGGMSFTGIAVPLDVDVVDSLEVVRGPAAIIYGDSDYGGTVNVRLKKPQAKAAFIGGWGGDVDGSSRFLVDVTGPLSANGRLRGRLSLSYNDTQSPQELAYLRSTSIAPSLSWDLTDRDTVDLNLILQHRPLRSSFGFALTEDLKFPAVSKKAFMGADFSLGNTDTRLGLVQESHRFNNHWTLTASGLSVYIPRESNETIVYGAVAANGDAPLYMDGYASRITDSAADLTLTGDFKVKGRTQTLALSASKRRTVENYFDFGGGYSDSAFDVYDPDPFDVLPALPALPTDPEHHRPENLTWDSHTDQRSQGVSGMLLLHPLERTTVLLGLRHTDFQLSSSGYYDRSVSYLDSPVAKTSATNKRLGVVYEVAHDVNLYASYSDGTIPNFGSRAVSGRSLPAETGVQLEAGAKAALFGQKLTLASAVFQIDRQNIAVHDPTTPPDSPFSILITGQKHRGFEFEAIGEPIPGLNLIASYSYLDIRINMCVRVDGVCTDPFGWNGHQQPNSPKNTLKLYSTYQLLSGPLHGFSMGGGLIHASQRDVAGDGLAQMPAYTRVDARLGYDALEHLSFSMNVINLTDATIYTSNFAYLYGGIDYQDRRTVMFDVGFKY